MPDHLDATPPAGGILLVGGSAAETALFSDVLTGAGYRLGCAPSVLDAVAMAGACLPEMILVGSESSPETCGIMRSSECLRDVPLLRVGGREGGLNGADDRIGLPCAAEEILARIRTHLALRMVRVRFEENLQNCAAARKAFEDELSALRESRDLLEVAIDQSPLGIMIADAPDVVIRYANPAATGTPEQGEVFFLAVDKDRRAFEPETHRCRPDGSPYAREELPLHRAVQKGEVVRSEEIIHLDGEGNAHWVEVSAAPVRDAEGKITAGIVFLQDVTERKQTEAALRESERKAKAILDLAFGFIGLLAPSGLLLEANRTALEFSGIAREEVVGLPFWECPWWTHDPDAQAQVRAGVEAAARGELVRFEATHRSAGGEIRNIDVSLKPVRNEAGEVILLIPEGRDITARKQAEESRERLQSQLLQSQKMELVGRLAGGVAHDFNNMLGVIFGRVDLALELVEPGSRVCECLEEIRKAADHSANLTRQLLTFARKQEVVPRTVDLNDAIEGTLKMMRRIIGEDIELDWKPAAGLWPVRVDPSQVEQVLANLCVNARAAVQGVGRISIETRKVAVDARYCHGHPDAAPGDYVVLIVSDTGCGMSVEVREHIFEPFFTTKEQGQGTGLGLATVYGIVQQNGGFISVYSEPGQGSSFRIHLPRTSQENHEAQPEASRPIPRGRGELLLVVEDEEGLRKITCEMLESLGYRVLSSTSPLEALELARTHPGPISMLVTDVVMPGMNGKELADCIHEQLPGIKCLFISGYTANIISGQGVLAEGSRFLQKPHTFRELAAKVREALDGE